MLVYHIITEPKSVGYVEHLDSTQKSPIRDVGSMQGYAKKIRVPFMKQLLEGREVNEIVPIVANYRHL
jgi:hypothetical protein